MADLPDYYTQTQISEAEAASFKGGLDANKSDTPVSRDIYYATDSKILRICVVDGTWININALYLLLAGGTMTGAIAMGTKKITGLGAGAANADAIQKQQAILQALLTTQGDLAIRGASVAERLAKITTGQVLKATATGYEGYTPIPATKEFFIWLNETESTELIGDGANLDHANDKAYSEKFYIPHDFTTLVDAVAIVKPQGTATMRFDLVGQYGAIGESPTIHNETDTDIDLACTVNEQIELDISGVLANLSAGDICVVRVTADATVNIPDCYVYGFRIKYT